MRRPLHMPRLSRRPGCRRLAWLAIAALVLVVTGCGGGANASALSAAATLGPDASPSVVYRTYQAYQREQKEGLMQAAESLRALAAAGREAELDRARHELLGTTDPGSMTPFISRAQAQKWASIPAEKRNAWFARYLGEESFPSRLEVTNEAIDGDRATLDVRGYFEDVDGREPGWSTGTITLAREGGRWKVEDEAWDWAAPEAAGSEAVDTGAAHGRFEVSGGFTCVVDPGTVSESRQASHGGWNFSVHDDACVVMFKNVPGDLPVGEYPFAADMPSIPEDWDWETPLDFPMHVVLAERLDAGELGRTWEDNVAGVLTVEALAGAKVSGRFEFTAGSVKVLGSFRNVEIPASESASVANGGESIALARFAHGTLTE